MLNLLRADFRKFFKGRLFIVLIVLLVIFPAFTAGSFLILKKVMPDEGVLPMTALSAMTQAFTPTSNFGLIFLIFMIIILATEFNQNTIRNKVIAGHSRQTIYVSSLVFNLITTLASFLLYAFLSFVLVGLVVGFTGLDFGELMETLIICVLATTFLYALLHLVVFLTRSTVISIVIMLGLPLFSIIVVQLLISLAGSNIISTELVKAIIITNPIFRLALTSMTGFGNFGILSLDGLGLLWSILSILFWIGLVVYLGVVVNRRIDYK